jgi:hypothetical protein
MLDNSTYESGAIIEFRIDYQSEIVKFINGTINNKSSMYLKEFAISVLGIEPDTKEHVALFLGKEIEESYNKSYKYYIIKQIKSKKNYFDGTIQKINTTE